PLSGKPDEPDNYHVVTIMLADGADRTEVSLTQENNDDEQSRLESEKNWSAMLEGLKAYVEKS
ncbi:MAG: SRPBCC domain-containing protein, partial [Arenimonas sp.]